MKTIEEKAKAYDEAIKRAKELISRCIDSRDRRTIIYRIDDIEEIFPELKESEDESIKREIVAYINELADLKNEKIPTKWLAWFEKQGEQKPTDKVEPRFKDGDWIVHHGTENTYQVVNVTSNLYQLKYGDMYILQNCADVDRCARLWDITKDAKDGDVIFYDSGWTCIFKCIHGIWYSFYCFITDDGEFHTGYEEHLVNAKINGNANPATKKQRDTLMKAMTDAGYTFDFEKKELKRIEQKPTDKINPKFKVGDWIVTPENKVLHITNIEGTSYVFNNESHYWENCYCDEKCRLWTINDAKNGDVLVCPLQKGCENGEQIFIFKGINSRDYVDNCIEYYCRICQDVFYENENGYMGTTSSPLHPSTKEQRDLLFAKMKEAGYEWDAEKKKLKYIEPKTLNANKVIEWLKPYSVVIDDIVEQFKKDFLE